MHHVCRIARILNMPRGHALLVGRCFFFLVSQKRSHLCVTLLVPSSFCHSGVGGSGKQSLAKLAAYICSLTTFQFAVHPHFGIPELKDNLHDLFLRCGGVQSQRIALILADSQILDERFLVYVNDLLSSGTVIFLINSFILVCHFRNSLFLSWLI